MSSDPSNPHGTALLLVLATLVIVTSTAVALLRLASTERVRWSIEHATRTADELMQTTELPIKHWLATSSSSVVLPPEATQPALEVLHDMWQLNGQTHEIRITAWDQCGMVPVATAQSGSPLRLGVPDEVLTALDELELQRKQVLGLDLFDSHSDYLVYPVLDASEPTLFGFEALPPLDELPDHAAPTAIAVGAHAATHNPGVINVNTAPMVLVEAALRAVGRGGIEQIEMARAEGASPGTVTRTPDRRRDPSRLRLTSTSTSWAFRIDIRVGPVCRSWWEIHQRSGDDWKRVQRLAILN